MPSTQQHAADEHLQSPTFTPARENPFAVDHVTAFPFRFRSGDWTSHLDRLRDMEFRGAVIGPQGSGKTTLLDQLKAQILDRFDRPAHYLRVPSESPFHARICEEAIEQAREKLILLDSAERLSWIKWRRIRKHCAHRGLVIAMHRPTRLPTWIETKTSAELLIDLVRELGYRPSALADAEVHTVFERFGGNIRDALRHFYDQVACGKLACPPPHDI